MCHFYGRLPRSRFGSEAQCISSLEAPGPLGIVHHESEWPTDDRLYLYPLAKLHGGETLFVFPSGTASSIVHRALSRAKEHALAGPMGEALHKANLLAARQYLDRIRWERLSSPAGLTAAENLREDFYRFDADKVAQVVSIVDTLEDYEAGRPFTSWDFTAIQAELNERLVAARAALRGKRPVSVLHILVVAPLGRTSTMTFTEDATDEQSELLVLATDDLDLITHLEAPERLGLWRFARALGRLHASTQVLSFSRLDDYAIYRGSGSSFYLSDDRPPNLLNITPGSGGTIRTHERQRIDEHGVPLPRSGGVVAVSRWEADEATPIYQPQNSRYASYRLVELEAPCWVVPTPGSQSEVEICEDLAEAVAFWLWRCEEELRPSLARFRDKGIVIEARFVTPDLSGAEGAGIEPTSSWISCEVTQDERVVKLTLLEGSAQRLVGATNDGERALAGVLVATIGKLAGLADVPSPAEIAASLPAGPMRMIHLFGDVDDLLFQFGSMGPPRLVSACDSALLLDDVGELTSQFAGILSGNIPDGNRTEALNDIVSTLFDRLKQRLSCLQSDELLRWLAFEQEALIFAEARSRLLIPAQAACFGEDSSAVHKAIASSPERISTSVANRFLLEAATAMNPSGSETLSLGLYEELIALAVEIVELGFLSDAIYYELSSTHLSVLPSGRLGVSRDDPYQDAVTNYTTRTAEAALDMARSMFADHWQNHASVGAQDDGTALNNAFEAEFGIAASELAQVQGDLMEIAGTTSARSRLAIETRWPSNSPRCRPCQRQRLRQRLTS